MGLSVACMQQWARRGPLEATPRELRFIEDPEGRNPFRDWLALQDETVRALIRVRLRKVKDGNLGDIKFLGNKVYELRLHDGCGWRIYIAQAGPTIYLLGGGMKKNQQRDMEAAKAFWSEHGD